MKRFDGLQNRLSYKKGDARDYFQIEIVIRVKLFTNALFWCLKLF